jgi:hypothetical protein
MSRNAVKRARPLTGSLPLAIVCHSLMTWPEYEGCGNPLKRRGWSAFMPSVSPELLAQGIV